MHVRCDSCHETIRFETEIGRCSGCGYDINLFKCPNCKELKPWSEGASDDQPTVCSDCYVFERERGGVDLAPCVCGESPSVNRGIDFYEFIECPGCGLSLGVGRSDAIAVKCRKWNAMMLGLAVKVPVKKGILVQLTYFTKDGSYHGEGSYRSGLTRSMGFALHDIWNEVLRMWDVGELPGVDKGDGLPGSIMAVVPAHHRDKPTLLFRKSG